MDKAFESDWSEEPTVTEEYRPMRVEVFGEVATVDLLTGKVKFEGTTSREVGHE